MKSLLRFAGAIDRFTRWLGKTAGWIILPLIAVIIFDVVTRKLDVTRLYFSEITAHTGLSVSTILQDLEWHFHAVLLLMTFGFAYLANAHVRVDVFRELLPHRKQTWLEFFGLLILAVPFLYVMLSEAWQMTSLSFHQGEGSDSLTGIGVRWIIKSFLIFGFTTAAMAVIATLMRLLVVLFGGAEDRLDAERALEIYSDVSDELKKAREEAERAVAAEQAATHHKPQSN
ncbi:MAG: TRAP transporter small permease subunit [Burkholderiaceae bacterium]|nr:TRAP transporter small permease subunit [Burkholderiaceae bacterium]